MQNQRVHRCVLAAILFGVAGWTQSAEAQVAFEPGYFVTHDGTRFNCLILNADWKNNPAQVTYKMEASGQLQTGTLDTWKEFGIDSGATYVLFRAAIDRSSNDLGQLDLHRNTSFSSEKLFLRRLISGKASLYVYEEENLFRLFFSVAADSVQPLIFKKYKTEAGMVARNETFKQQLTNQLACPHVSAASARKLRYIREDMVDYFQHFNTCQGDGSVTRAEPYRVRTHINLRLGAGFNTYHLSSSYYDVDDEWGPVPSFRVGLEAEFTLPFGRNKWSLATEAGYVMFKTDGITHNGVPMHIVYNTIEISIGPRYRFFLDNTSTLSLGGGICFKAPIGSEITISNIPLSAGPVLSPWLALGYQWRGLSAEMRYIPPWNNLDNYVNWTSKMSGTPMLILSFRLN